MRNSNVNNAVFGLGVTALILAGCGGQSEQLRSEESSIVPQIAARTGGPAHPSSWMLPEAKGENLLYISTGFSVYVYSYPAGKLVGTLGTEGLYLCSDLQGDVFLTQYNTGNIYEYAHGGTSPIATLSDPGGPWSCAVDPVTGNLAAANMYGPGGPGNVAIFPKAQNPAQIYSDPNMTSYSYCGYDDRGNLFVDGGGFGTSSFAELPKGSSFFTDITLNQSVYSSSVIQWDGSYVTIADAGAHEIDRVVFSGSSGTIVGQTRLRDWHQGTFKEIWLQGSAAIAQPAKNGSVAVWKYPNGDYPKRYIGHVGRIVIYGVTMSRAPATR